MGLYNDKLETEASEIQKRQPDLSWTDAFDLACNAHPDLYAKAVNEPADVNQLAKGRSPHIRAHTDDYSKRMEKQSPIEADEHLQLDELADKHMSKHNAHHPNNPITYFVAYDMVATANPDLYEKAVNGGVTQREAGVAKMLADMQSRMSNTSLRMNDTDRQRLQEEIEQVRNAMTSSPFTSEPGVMESLAKFESMLNDTDVLNRETDSRSHRSTDDERLDSYAKLADDHLSSGVFSKNQSLYQTFDDLLELETTGGALLDDNIYQDALDQYLKSDVIDHSSVEMLRKDGLFLWLGQRLSQTNQAA